MLYEPGTTLNAVDAMDDRRRAVGVHEEIKGVVSAARELSLAAINSMLVARRAGADVRGFGLASTGLRGFSSKLQARMDVLALDMADLIRDVASLTGETRPRLADALARVDRVLARSAKIEAVYGGRFSAQPGQAGVAIDCSIELIRYRLFNAWSIAA
jgi:hypothetical protein